jgi:hypothetical protein
MTDQQWFFGGLAAIFFGVGAILLFEVWQRRRERKRRAS